MPRPFVLLVFSPAEVKRGTAFPNKSRSGFAAAEGLLALPSAHSRRVYPPGMALPAIFP